MARGPDEPGSTSHAKGLDHGHNDRRNDTAANPHIVQGISFMGIMDMSTERRQHKADNQSHTPWI